MGSNTENAKEAKEFNDGRRVVIHYHRPKDTLPPGTLQNFLLGTHWTELDLKRLGLTV